MARELKIPAKGGGWRGRSGDMAHVRLSGGETGVPGAGYVLDEVYVVHVAVPLVHALAGRSLPLEVSPLGRAWRGSGRAVSCISRQSSNSNSCKPTFVWGLTLFILSYGLGEGGDLC